MTYKMKIYQKRTGEAEHMDMEKRNIMIPKRSYELFHRLATDPAVQSMSQYNAHKNTNTLQHSINVTIGACWLAVKFRLSEEHIENAVMAGMLHDFYLYDYHGRRVTRDGWHAWRHPKIALQNAASIPGIAISKRAGNAIRSHMFPGTLFHMPLYAEAWLVSLSDKICATCELLGLKGFNGYTLTA